MGIPFRRSPPRNARSRSRAAGPGRRPRSPPRRRRALRRLASDLDLPPGFEGERRAVLLRPVTVQAKAVFAGSSLPASRGFRGTRNTTPSGVIFASGLAGVEQLVRFEEDAGRPRRGLHPRDRTSRTGDSPTWTDPARLHPRHLIRLRGQAGPGGVQKRGGLRIGHRLVGERLVERQRVAVRDAVHLADEVVDVGGDRQDVAVRLRARSWRVARMG